MKYFHVPEEAGISRQAIANFLQALQAHNYRLHALMIARRSGVCYADAVAPYTLDTPHRLCSAAKSILSLNLLAANQAASEPHDMDQNFDILDQYLFCVPHPDHLEEDPEGYAALRNYMEQLSIPTPGSAVPHGNLEGWEGVYLRKAGNFHLQPELRPFGNINANRDFYTITNENVEKLEIHRCAEGFRLTMNDQLSVIARLDGKWIPHFAQSAMPAYDQSCATVIAEKDQLEITQWFFQTCFKTKLWITRTGDELHIKVRKERLHDDWPYIWSEAIMQREQQ